jgi:hypothetical protein
LGDRIYEPGNENLCYEIDFGIGLKPLKPPILPLPKPTFVSPLAKNLTLSEDITCYKKVGDWMFTPGNEELCEIYDNGENVNITHITQETIEIHPHLKNETCISEFYEFAYLCKDNTSLTNAGFPNLTSKGTWEPINITKAPTAEENSRGHEFKNPDLKKCFEILGDRLFEPGNDLICFRINFGKGMTPLEDETCLDPKPENGDWKYNTFGSDCMMFNRLSYSQNWSIPIDSPFLNLVFGELGKENLTFPGVYKRPKVPQKSWTPQQKAELDKFKKENMERALGKLKTTTEEPGPEGPVDGTEDYLESGPRAPTLPRATPWPTRRTRKTAVRMIPQQQQQQKRGTYPMAYRPMSRKRPARYF